MTEDPLSTKENSQSVSVSTPSKGNIATQLRPVIFTIVGTGIFGFILWGVSEFLSLRGVVDLTASRIILALIWFASTLGASAVVARTTIKRRTLAIVLSSTTVACLLVVLDTWAPKPSIRANAKSEVALRFVNAEDPFAVIMNISDIGARDIKWAVELWNMDLPDRNDPLPIPTGTFDWLKPHSEGGPQNLFDTPSVAPLLKTGNRLFGSAMVDCPDCLVGRTYIVYIEWGGGGWFSEVRSAASGQILIPKNFSRPVREVYFKELDAMVPLERRVQILPQK